MREVQITGRPGPTASIETRLRWLEDIVMRIAEASRDEASPLARNFTLSNVAESRTLDPTTATVAQTAQVLATLISDMKKGGKNRVG